MALCILASLAGLAFASSALSCPHSSSSSPSPPSSSPSSSWTGESIYFVVTDRFSPPSTPSTPYCQGKDWCGGTLSSLTSQLPYIQSLGFTALWLTPVVEQVPWLDNWNGTGYHGYWASDFNAIDPHFGTEADFLALTAAARELGVKVMLDIVANHVGPVHSLEEVSKLAAELSSPSGTQFNLLPHPDPVPFSSYLRDPYTMMEAGSQCWPYYDFSGDCNYTIIEKGWFGDLGDLNHDNPDVRKYLLDWIRSMKKKYNLDGFRLDTALYIPTDFLAEMQESAEVLITGEVVVLNVSLHACYQSYLDGLLNFPVTENIKPTFNSSGGSFTPFASVLSEQLAANYVNPHTLFNFVDNHDSPRFMYSHTPSEFANAATFVFLWHGVPVWYYGSEVVEVATAEDERVSQWDRGGFREGGDTFAGGLAVKLNALRDEFGFGRGQENREVRGVREEAFTGYRRPTPETFRTHGCLLTPTVSQKLAEVLEVEEKFMVFRRGGATVVVSNYGGREEGKVCWEAVGGDGDLEERLGYYDEVEVFVEGEDGEICVTIGSLPMVLAAK